MDQLHEELKEPLTESGVAISNLGAEAGDTGAAVRDGDRSPAEDDFLSCDSGSSSGEGGEGRGGGDAELLIQDECGGVRAAATTTTTTTATTATAGVGISEKERLKERRVSGSPLRGASQEMDEDADVDTAAPQEVAGERQEEEVVVCSSTQNQSQANSTAG